jgi:tetratricopeptide (TPR) repeat protein
MIRILFYLLLSVSGFPSDLFAQQKKIDSLNKILMQNNLADSVRLKSLIKLATITGGRNQKLGDSLYHQALTLAHRSKNLYGEIRALIGLANFQRRDKNFSASRESLSQALQLAQKNHVSNFATDAVNDFYADCLVFPGNGIQELEYAFYYLKLAEQYELQALVGDACSQLGLVLAANNYSSAINYHNRALGILGQTEYNHTLIHASSLFGSAETYKNHGDFDEAIQQFKRSSKLAVELNSAPIVIEIECALASIYQRQKQYDEAFVTAFRVFGNATRFEDRVRH